jgi:hypothetical protein
LSEATVHYGPHDPHPRAATEAGCGVRLAELVAALSLATDLGLGQPQEHIIRQTLIAMRVAELRNFTDDERAAIFYVSLLAWVGCVAVGEVGGRLHVAWRLRLHPTPWDDHAWHVIEQQTYPRAGEHIDAIDLLCSGLQPEGQI